MVGSFARVSCSADRPRARDSSVEPGALDSQRGLLLRVRPRVRPGRGLHAAGRRSPTRRPTRAPVLAQAAGVPRGRRRGGGLPGALPDRLRHRRPAASRTRCSTRRRPRSTRSSPRTADLRPVLVVGAPLVARHPGAQLRGGHPPRAGPRGGAEVLPADLPRVLRAPLLRPGRRPPRAPSIEARRRRPVPFGPDLIFRGHRRARTCDLHVEICEDMWVPIPPSAEAALAGATVLANLSGSPITVARAEDRRLLVRSASARCSAAYVFAAAGQGESTTDLSWDGQTMVYECGDLLAEGERFPDGPRHDRRRRRPRPDPPGAAAAGHLRRQPADPRRRGSAAFRTVELRARAADRRHRAAPQGRPLPVRARRPRAARARLLRGLQHPGLRPRAAAVTRSVSPRSSSGSAAASTRPTR